MEANISKESFGLYRPLEELGSGAMGVVYRAQHLETQEIFALKTLKAPRPELSEALQREIYALSRLSHPGVISIQDFGISNGQPWYTMPLLPGKTLRELCGSPWREDEILPLFRSLCESLAFLHGNGVIHRDLKPENILLVEKMGEGSSSRLFPISSFCGNPKIDKPLIDSSPLFSSRVSSNN